MPSTVIQSKIGQKSNSDIDHNHSDTRKPVNTHATESITMKLLSLVGVILLLTVTFSNVNGQDFDDEDDFNYNVEESPTEPEPEKKEESS